jgi:hypothetical protein
VRIDVVSRLGAIRAHFEDVGDRSAPQPFAKKRFHFGFQAADIIGELDDRFEKAIVERADFDGVMRPAALGAGVAKTGHADNHSNSP